MRNYSAKIIEGSREFTARERLKYTDFTDAISIADALNTLDESQEFIIKPIDWCVVEIHNAYSKDNTDYKKYMIIAEDDVKFCTSSESLFTRFREIFDSLKEEGDDGFTIKIYGKESKNYKGNNFLTCSLV